MDPSEHFRNHYFQHNNLKLLQTVQQFALPSTLPNNVTSELTHPDETLTVPPDGTDEGALYPLAEGFLRQEPWTVAILAASATNAIAIVAFEVYIIIRATRGTPSRRHLFLGQCLLLGLFLCSLSGVPLTLEPSYWSCSAARLSVSIAPALVFGTLLVKTVFLISLNSGVYLPAHYQGLLLFFVVLVQVSISVQWLTASPASVVVYESSSPGVTFSACAATYRHVLLSLLYVILLMVAVTVLAIKCRGYRENYREASYIGVSMGVVLPLWLAWTMTGLILPIRLQPACLGFGIIITASIIFLIMFIPKGRQLAAVGKDGLYSEDRDDRLSTVSDARYSPSFFLFKPIKPAKEIIRPANSVYKSPPSGSSTLTDDPESRHSDDALYSTIGRPFPSFIPAAHPNFYLFRSHAHTGMFY